MANFIHQNGYQQQAERVQKFINHYKQMIMQISVALDVCDIDVVNRCLRKPNGQAALQKKIDQGVLKKYGPNEFERFMRGEALQVANHYDHQELAVEIAANYYDFRWFEKWRLAASPVYLMYVHPRQVSNAFEQVVKTLRNKIKQGEDPVAIAVWTFVELINIHIYADGNKRVGKALLNLLLGMSGIPLIDFNQGNAKDYYKMITQDLRSRLALPANQRSQTPETFFDFVQALLAQS